MFLLIIIIGKDILLIVKECLKILYYFLKYSFSKTREKSEQTIEV
jgi:hypothetical protein